VSGGQKRRVSVASQLITSPKILFMDEPTSGLDSAAAYEVIAFVRDIAKKHNVNFILRFLSLSVANVLKLLVIASIHQPSTATFELFDKLLLLSKGRTAYNGPVSEVQKHFASLGFEMPLYTNPAEYILDLVNTDFAHNQTDATQELGKILGSWETSLISKSTIGELEDVKAKASSTPKIDEELDSANKFLIPITLTHRAFLKSYRDLIAYGIRIAMYMGLAIMMGTVWLRLGENQENIRSFLNAIVSSSLSIILSMLTESRSSSAVLSCPSWLLRIFRRI
jgi:ABC-type multidrug transport system ATPase subunit